LILRRAEGGHLLLVLEQHTEHDGHGRQAEDDRDDDDFRVDYDTTPPLTKNARQNNLSYEARRGKCRRAERPVVFEWFMLYMFFFGRSPPCSIPLD
jgi:hypothetical protein